MKYDLVVIGGGTAGCATAYTAAKQGLKTLLIEKNTYLGGSITGAQVIPAMKSSDNQINTEFFTTFINELNALCGQVTYIDGNQGWINPELVKIALDKLLVEAGVEIFLSTYINKITTKNNKILSIDVASSPFTNTNLLSESIETAHVSNNIRTKELLVSIESSYFVDATGNADFCTALNCHMIDDCDLKQPCSLRFIAGGVDLDKFSEFILDLDKDRNATTAYKASSQTHCSTACTWDKDWALSPIFKQAVLNGDLEESDRAYFQLFTIPGAPGCVAFNCPRCPETFEISNIKAKSEALIIARKSILRLVNFTKKYLPGFENCYISSIAPELGVRVSKRPLGKYLYTIEDLRNGHKFENPVLVSNYPIDVHSANKSGAKLEKVYQEYQLPLESLMSIDYNNLFFAGRCVSADFYAQAALRIIPSCFSMGEGLAKYLANKRI